MIHEVSRSDRDNYVHFQCENFDRYTDAIAAAMHDNSGWTRLEAHTELCEDQDFADQYNFLGAEFVKIAGQDEPEGLDLDSIQLYTSTDFMDRVECFTNPNACPIAAWDEWAT
ncbi:uncharacterized protein M421DRAFT_6257 [Didymella exigua CBS 183.55]|uniref:Uncharacterized protein n=1 Tax=Didymella exigua CBS 183.55 TaxID=1150837 RepID=A0A6A5RGP0_9PLEO|nr:uncharacterized protein M421DRAFT_6257 [Didymella exigua CBS 183.55]KAF1927491.1 hypothetical protein M421DRAFT_6257 [Didymella exigua CBS 183.55]